MKHAAVWLCSSVVLLMLPGLALADPTAAERTTATQLFDDAEKLIASGNAGDACPKYAESERLDPQLGTRLHLANCYEKAGKTASAWSTFKEATEVAAKRGDPREATARARAASLERKLSKLVITVAPGTTSEIEVRQDGEVVRRAVWGSAVPVDPGPHTITASAKGYKTWETKSEVNVAGAISEVKIPALEPMKKGEVAPAAVAPAVPPVVVAPGGARSKPTPSVQTGSRQRTAGLVVAGGGLMAIGVSLGIGQSAKSQYESANCPNNVCHTSTDGSERDKAATKGIIATVAFSVGTAALVGGCVMWLTAPTASESVSGSGRLLRIGVAPGKVLLEGAF